MQLEFFLNFPSMERENLRDLKKGIDLTFKDFSREYGDSIEGFFGPLLKFLVWFEKFLITTPWPLIIILLSFLAWLSSRSIKLSIGTAISFFLIGYFGMWKDTMSTMAINATQWFSSDWAKEKGLYSEVFDSAIEMDQHINALANKLAASSTDAMVNLKKTLWEGTEDWDFLLDKRAKISGELILSDFSKNAIKKIKAANG